MPAPAQEVIERNLQEARSGVPSENAIRRTEARPDRPPINRADGVWENMKASWQRSVTGLRFRGELPDLAPDEEQNWAEWAAGGVTGIVGDIPTLAVGGILGGLAGAPAGPVGAAAGAGGGAEGLTRATRKWMLESYQKGAQKRDVAARITATAWEGTKGTAVGAATAGVGSKVYRFLRGSPPQIGALPGGAAPTTGAPRVNNALVRHGITGVAEGTTLVGVHSALEREIPGPGEFLDAALMLTGLRVGTSIGTRAVRRRAEQAEADRIQGRLEEIYHRTGKRPAQVVQDMGADDKLARQVLDDEFGAIPDRYRADDVSPLALDENRLIPEGANVDPRLQRMARDPTRAGYAEDRGRHHLNLKTLDLDEGPAKLADELTGVFAEEMKRAQRGRVSHAQTGRDAEAWLRATLGKESTKSIYDTGSIQWAAELKARKEVMEMSLRDAYAKADELTQAAAGDEDLATAAFLTSMDRARHAQAAYRRSASEAGRALEVIKAREKAFAVGDEQAILRELERFGSKEQAKQLAELTQQARSNKELAALAREATFGDKVQELWKSTFLLSGPQTMAVNFLGNILLGATRIPERQLAGIFGLARKKGVNKVEITEGVAQFSGWVQGMVDSVRAAKMAIDQEGIIGAIRDIKQPAKAELSRQTGAIKGAKGEIIRLPFKALTVGDLLGRKMMYNAEIASAAARRAGRDGLTPFSQAWRERYLEYLQNPSKKAASAAEDVAERFVLMQEGPIINAMENLRNVTPGAFFIVPFIKAPSNILRESFRRSPLAATMPSFWREIKAGGARADQAMAEVTLGTGLMFTAFMLARDGVLQGGGHPDDKQRQADYAAGYQPYSVKMQSGKQISFDRWEPVGTLVGLSTDLAQAWDLMTEGEQDSAASALAWAGVEVVKNKTWLRGLTEFLDGVTQPERYGQGWLEQFASSWVPNIVGTTARQMDPYVREVNSVLDAVKARIPKIRESLPPIREMGEPVERAGLPFFPSSTREMTDDPVLLEARRLGVAMPRIPQKLHAVSIAGEEKRVELTADQRDKYAERAGKIAKRELERLLGSPSYDRMPDLFRARAFDQIFRRARQQAAHEVLPPGKREEVLELFEAELRAEGLLGR